MKKMNTRTLAYAGVLIALNVILSRFLSIPIGNLFRISFGSVPVFLSGLWFGPLTGGLTGLIGDLIGCAVNGYAPNPFITVSAVLNGVIPALFVRFLRKKTSPLKYYLKFLLVLALNFLITSQGFTVLGLSVMYGMPFGATFVSRIPQSLCLCAVDAFLCSVLFKRVKVGETGDSV